MEILWDLKHASSSVINSLYRMSTEQDIDSCWTLSYTCITQSWSWSIGFRQYSKEQMQRETHCVRLTSAWAMALMKGTILPQWRKRRTRGMAASCFSLHTSPRIWAVDADTGCTERTDCKHVALKAGNSKNAEEYRKKEKKKDSHTPPHSQRIAVARGGGCRSRRGRRGPQCKRCSDAESRARPPTSLTSLRSPWAGESTWRRQNWTYWCHWLDFDETQRNDAFSKLHWLA